jgi:hypothetical protein
MYLHEENEYSPIIVFTYNRSEHLNKTILSLKKNIESKFSDLFVYSDGPKNSQDEILIKELRIDLRKITGFKTINIIERPINFGLSKSVTQGVSEVLSRYDRAIILEDDMITSPYFLGFMNQALTKYKKNQNVACVHGYVYPGLKESPGTFFLRGADCWGWGTWRDSWKLFNPNGKFLLNQLRDKNLIKQFDFNGSYPFSKMLQNQVLGKNDSWAIRWYASIFLENRLTLYPSRSLLENIGMDSSGQNCTNSSHYDVNVATEPLFIGDIEVKHSESRYKEFERFFHAQNKNLFQRIVGGIKGWL